MKKKKEYVGWATMFGTFAGPEYGVFAKTKKDLEDVILRTLKIGVEFDVKKFGRVVIRREERA